MPPKLLNKGQLAASLGVHRRAITAMCSQGFPMPGGRSTQALAWLKKKPAAILTRKVLLERGEGHPLPDGLQKTSKTYHHPWFDSGPSHHGKSPLAVASVARGAT